MLCPCDFDYCNTGPIARLAFSLGSGNVRSMTLYEPYGLNVISSRMVSILAEDLEEWEKDDNAQLVLIEGVGSDFSANEFSRMFCSDSSSKDSCLEVAYRYYWLFYHIYTYKKMQVAFFNFMSMGGGAALMASMKCSVVSEETVFSTPDASIWFHTICGFSYILSRLPGYLGEYLALTGATLTGKELVAAGLATYFVPFERVPELLESLYSLNTGEEKAVKSVIEGFSVAVQIDEDSILNKKATIDACFSKGSVEEIIEAFEAEASKDGHGWITPVLKGLKRFSLTGLKITLKSIREGRNQSLAECLKKEVCLTMNILRETRYADVYQGIRVLTVDEDNSPKHEHSCLDKVDDEKVSLMFKPFPEDLELNLPESEGNRWEGKYESLAYATAGR